MLWVSSYLDMVIDLILTNEKIWNFGFNFVPVLESDTRKKNPAWLSQQNFTSVYTQLYAQAPGMSPWMSHCHLKLQNYNLN